jgi:RND family efflux transporter MFP subunit
VHDQKDILVPAKPPASARTGRGVTIFAVVVMAGLLVGFVIVQRIRAHKQKTLDLQTSSSAGAAMPVDVVRVERAPSSRPLQLPGDTRGWYQTTIYARVPGYVAKWLVDIGDRVHTGQHLLQIDTPELDAQLAAAQAHLKVSQAQVEVQKANVAFAKTTYQRWREAGPGVVADQDREEKKAAYDAANATLDAAAAQVNLDKAEVDRLNALEGFKQVTAPFDGVITARRIDIGDLVTAGSANSTTSLYSLAQCDKIRVFVDMPQNAAMQIGPDTPAQVATADLAGHIFDGKVARTSSSIDPASKTMSVEVDLDNPGLLLVPGMYVMVDFHLHQPPWVQVPASAIVFKSKSPQVAVVGKDSQVMFHDISIAFDQGDVVYVSSGVAPGDRVALNIGNQVEDGDKVDVHETDGAATPPQTPVTSAQQSE